MRPRIVRPVLFAVLVGGLAIIYTAEMTNEDIRYHAARAADARGMLSAFGGSATSLAATGGTGVSVREMHMSRAQEHAQRTLSLAKTFGNTGIPMIDSAVLALANKWYRTDEATRTSAGIIVACSVVWAAWHVKRWQPHMWKWWAHQPLSGRSTTLLTSVFSHVVRPRLHRRALATDVFSADTTPSGTEQHCALVVRQRRAQLDDGATIQRAIGRATSLDDALSVHRLLHRRRACIFARLACV